MINKKLEAKRLIIFLLLAFGISWIPAIIMNCAVGYHEWFETYKMPFFALIVLFGTALANVITRKITHEGWHDSMLHLKLKGNIKILSDRSILGSCYGNCRGYSHNNYIRQRRFFRYRRRHERYAAYRKRAVYCFCN